MKDGVGTCLSAYLCLNKLRGVLPFQQGSHSSGSAEGKKEGDASKNIYKTSEVTTSNRNGLWELQKYLDPFGKSKMWENPDFRGKSAQMSGADSCHCPKQTSMLSYC